MDANDILRASGPNGVRKAFDQGVRPADVAPAVPETAQRPRVRLLTPEEFEKERTAHTEYIVQGLVRTGTLVSVGSRPGFGKTALLVELAKALGAGEDFLGRETKRAAVAYYAAEDAIDVKNRLKAVGSSGVFLSDFVEGLPLTRPDYARELIREAITELRKKSDNLPVVLIIDTLRAALGDVSVLEDRVTSPTLNMLRDIAEKENAVIVIANHTNRENEKLSKGETLESVVVLELVLLQSMDGWYEVRVGKNRGGQAHRTLGHVKYKSVQIGPVDAAIVDEFRDDAGPSLSSAPKRGENQRLLHRAIEEALASDPRAIVSADGGQVLAVPESLVAERFADLKPNAGRETVSKGFSRALDAAISNREIDCETDKENRRWLWQPAKR